MKYNEYSHRHGRELIHLLAPDLHKEVCQIFSSLASFQHGSTKGKTVKDYIRSEFVKRGWEEERKFDFSAEKKDFVDLYKGKIAIEMEWSRFEMFFRDFFRFMLLYERKQIEVGIILTYDDMAYQRWRGESKAYKSARASLQKLVDFLKGDYASVVRVPIWCIGIE